tara:strand:+ start:925 stop:1263 length:339 start_codon:yes stop_codon:yes gene_type:complete
MENSLFSAVIRSVKTFDVTYFDKKADANEQALCSVANLRLSDGTISQVFAFKMDLTKGFALADVKRVPHGQPLYEGGPVSTPGKDLVFEGAMTLEHAKGAVQAIELSEKLDM